ncbi:MAG TPA: CHAT domain-containing tetratricopeptide repeat protein [Gemmataceae bacterium]|nr:CHAT domain-containing tetratricopeptide repeat protein [Gemmataceae bacterium]
MKLLLTLACLGLAMVCPAAAQAPKDASRNKPEADDAARLKDLWNQAHKLAKEGKPKEALVVCETALGLAKAKLGESHKDTIALTHLLGYLYQSVGQYAKAEPLYRQALDFYEAKLGVHPDTALALSNLAWLYRDTGRYTKAEPLYRRALDICEAKLGGDHPTTALALNNLGLLYQTTGHFTKAEPLLERALAVREKKLGPDHPETAHALGNLANLYQAMGRYAKAEPLHQRAVEISEAKLGGKHPDTAQAIGNLALLHQYIGHYAKAESLYRRSLAIYEATLGGDHPDAVQFVNNLAVLYQSAGQYTKAEPLFDRALAARKARLGADHPATAQSLANLGHLYQVTGRHAKAEPLFRRALAICEEKLGADHSRTAHVLNNLAELYRETGQYARAEPLGRRAVAIGEEALGKDHPGTAFALNDLALLYQAMGDYTAAEPLFARAVDIYRARCGKDHPQTAKVLANAARLSAAQGRTGDAIRTLDRALRAYRRHSVEVLPTLSDGEQLEFLKRGFDRDLKAGLALALAGGLGEENRLRVAAWLLNGKAVATESMAEKVILARDADSPASRKVLAELEDVRQRLAGLALKADVPADPTQVEALKDRERRLAASLAAFDTRPRRDDPWYELDELRQRLPADAAYVDVARLPGHDFKTGKDGPDRYVAFVSFRSEETQVADLGSADPIDAAMRAVRREFDAAAKTIRDQGEPQAERDIRVKLAGLGKLVLDPLRRHIDSKARWIISPDSNLWLIPWAALPLDPGAYAVERHDIRYVVSGRDLLLDPLKLDRKTTAPVIVADPDFDRGPSGAITPAYPDAQRGLSKDFKLGAVRRLPGTAAEAEAILPHLEKFAGAKPRVLTDADAGTAAVRRLRSPRVLVLSTHGFFLEDELATRTSNLGRAGGENPLLRCGLLLAGCNRAEAAGPGADTGVLTGLEVVGTDLRGTELVVLSACETGVGEVRSGEGVAGLRQAFQLAGAEAVVATLWQVPDRDSALLMAGFFGRLGGGKARDAALREAQLEQVTRRRDRFGAAHPYFWAAYTLTGQTR